MRFLKRLSVYAGIIAILASTPHTSALASEEWFPLWSLSDEQPAKKTAPIDTTSQSDAQANGDSNWSGHFATPDNSLFLTIKPSADGAADVYVGIFQKPGRLVENIFCAKQFRGALSGVFKSRYAEQNGGGVNHGTITLVRGFPGPGVDVTEAAGFSKILMGPYQPSDPAPVDLKVNCTQMLEFAAQQVADLAAEKERILGR